MNANGTAAKIENSIIKKNRKKIKINKNNLINFLIY